MKHFLAFLSCFSTSLLFAFSSSAQSNEANHLDITFMPGKIQSELTIQSHDASSSGLNLEYTSQNSDPLGLMLEYETCPTVTLKLRAENLLASIVNQPAVRNSALKRAFTEPASNASITFNEFRIEGMIVNGPKVPVLALFSRVSYDLKTDIPFISDKTKWIVHNSRNELMRYGKDVFSDAPGSVADCSAAGDAIKKHIGDLAIKMATELSQ